MNRYTLGEVMKSKDSNGNYRQPNFQLGAAGTFWPACRFILDHLPSLGPVLSLSFW